MGRVYSLWEYPICATKGMDLLRDPRLVGAKRALTDGKTILVSPAMWDLFCEEKNSRERERIGRAIDVITVRSLRSDYREAF